MRLSEDEVAEHSESLTFEMGTRGQADVRSLGRYGGLSRKPIFILTLKQEPDDGDEDRSP